MTTTPRGAPELASGQAAPETTVNEQVRRTEAGASHFPVADRVTAPPGSCVDGAVYLIIATATGAFTGKENQLAVAVGTNAASGWYYRALGTKDEGVTAWVQDENARYLWSGTAWGADTGGGMAAASTTEQLTGTDSAKSSTPDSVAALWEQGSDVASAGTVSLGEGGYFVITGTTTITDIDFATDKAGRKVWVKFAGALTLTHNASTLILPTGASITTAAGDTACFVSEGADAVRCLAYQRASGASLGPPGLAAWELLVAVSDETTALTTGTAKVTFRMPRAVTLTEVRSSVTTAPTGSTLIVDINEGGASILSTKLSIDASEKTSTTAATAAVISDASLADDAEMTIDIDQVGSTIAGAGLKVLLKGTI